jgi:hypothetical protein
MQAVKLKCELHNYLRRDIIAWLPCPRDGARAALIAPSFVSVRGLATSVVLDVDTPAACG